MEPFMLDLASFLNINLKRYINNKNSEVLSISVNSIKNISILIEYFNKYSLLGNKLNDFKNWEIVYNMILSKEHLTENGRLKIKNIIKL
jgi:hypothetical protein